MKRILIINNDFDTMGLLKTWLETKGYQAVFTGNEDEVFHIIEGFDPELIIIDETQNNIITVLKNHSVYSSIPILLMTGYTTKFASRKLSADDIIEKPFILPLLENKIEKLIQGKHSVNKKIV